MPDLGLKSPFKDAWKKDHSGKGDDSPRELKGDVDVSGAKAVIGVPIGDADEALFDCLDHYSGQK